MHTRRFALRPFLALALAALTGQSHLSAQVTLPYTVDFEPSEGFSPGSLQGQGGWQVERGSAFVGAGGAFSGANAVTLSASTPPTAITQSFTRFFGEDVTFVDFYALPAADGNPAVATRMDVEAAQAGFFRIGGQGEVYAFDGDGQGGGQWVATGFTVPLDENGRARDWIRFTFRQDFNAKLWDLYLDGSLVQADLHFRDNTAASFSRFRLRGAPGADTSFDYFYASADNPLFADADKDGIDDAWELANGLDPTVNDRDVTSGKLSNIQRYLSAGKPGQTQADAHVLVAPKPLAMADAISAISGLRLRLQADAGVTADGSGFVSAWADQSGQGKNASQGTSANRPVVVTNVVNGQPVVRFDATQNQFLNVSSFMSGATEGEIFAVLKSGASAGLWRMGANNNAAYYSSGGIYDDFGSTAIRTTGAPLATLSTFALYNISAQSGSWIARLNGAVHYASSSNSVSFPSGTCYLGFNNVAYFSGDVAEIIAYDHVLTSAERDSVGVYLQTKYAMTGMATPSAPTSLAATMISSTQVNLTWSASALPDGSVYTIERQIGSGSFTAVADVSGGLSYFDTGLTAGTSYTYRVRARTYTGSSGYSSTATVVTDSAGNPDLPMATMRLWLRADAGVTQGEGRMPAWYDQSSHGLQGVQLATAQEPAMVANVVNGRPVVRFDATNNQYFSLSNFMSGATEGELFAVLKSGASAGLWRFGPNNNATYYSPGGIYEDFGSSTIRNTGVPTTAVNQFTVYQIAAGTNSWTSRLNGNLHYTSGSNTVGTFSSSPLLGFNTVGYFSGDIAEIIVYDQMLNPFTRGRVLAYLASKYSLTGVKYPAPGNLTARAATSYQVNLSWTKVRPDTSYTLERKTGAGSFQAVLTTSDATYADDHLTANTTYDYRLHATAADGDSSYSNVATVTTAPLFLALPQSGLRLWLTPDSATADGTGVTTWHDMSGSGNDAIQANSSLRPQLVTNQINGRPVVRFNGTSQHLTLPFLTNGATAGDLFVILRAQTPTGVDRSLFSLSGRTLYPAAGGDIADSFGASADHSVSLSGADLTQVHIYNATSTSGEWTARLDRQALYTTASNTVTMGSGSPAPLIGADYVSGVPGAWFAGDIAEIILYDHALTDPERQIVQQQLAARYGMAIAFPGDADNNGLPDAWETSVFGGTGVSPHADPDGDGLTNAQEYFSSANPFDFYNGRSFLVKGIGTSTYTYDASGRLALAAYANGSLAQFTFDSASNLTGVTEAGGLVAWRTTHSLTADGTGDGADTAVLGGDSLPNLVKYALGLDPHTTETADHPVITLTNISGSNYLTLTYTRPNPAPTDVIYKVEVSANGTTWTSVSGSTVAVSTTISSGIATVVVRDATAAGSPALGRRIRLSVERGAP